VLLAAVALGGEHDLLGRVVRDGPLDEEDVGLLAGLEDAELGVQGGPAGDHPVRTWLRAAAEGLDVVPGGPALPVVGIVVRAVVDVEERAEVRGVVWCGKR
jgi:hypothetical protein